MAVLRPVGRVLAPGQHEALLNGGCSFVRFDSVDLTRRDINTEHYATTSLSALYP